MKKHQLLSAVILTTALTACEKQFTPPPAAIARC